MARETAMADISSLTNLLPIKDCDPSSLSWGAIQVGELRGWRIFRHDIVPVFWALKRGDSTSVYKSLEACKGAIPSDDSYLGPAIFDELAAASDLLDQGKDPIEVAKATIKALQEIVDLSSGL